MDIKEWQSLFVEAVKKRKFSKGNSQSERYGFLFNDVEDVKVAMLVEGGKLDDITSNKHFSSVEERLGGVFLNLFCLVDQREADVEKILQGALDWLNDHNKKPTSGE